MRFGRPSGDDSPVLAHVLGLSVDGGWIWNFDWLHHGPRGGRGAMVSCGSASSGNRVGRMAWIGLLVGVPGDGMVQRRL